VPWEGNTDYLVKWDKAKQAIIEAHSVDELRKIRDKAEAYRYALKLAGEAPEVVRKAEEIKVRAERRAGELLRENPPKEGRPKKLSTDAIVSPTLLELGVTPDESHRWQRIAEIPEERFEQYIASADEITTAGALRVAKDVQRENQRQENAELVKTVNPLPQVKARTIVIDPPWDRGDEGDIDQFGRGQPTYSMMSLDELLALPIWERAEADAHLYLWITNRSLFKGAALFEAWGFRYITCLTWCKPSFGIGNYFRGQTEHVLFGVRGSLALLRKDVGTWFPWDRPAKSKHSAKPDEFYTLIESCSPGPWLDIFARKSRPGWISWGAEVGTDNI